MPDSNEASRETGIRRWIRIQIASKYTQAAWQAVKHFPVQVEGMEPVAHSENVTFRVAVRDGETDFVLRLHRPGYSSLEELQSERVWTRALKATGVNVPGSFETNQGGHYALVDIPDAGEQRYAGMTMWHEGIPLSDYLESHPAGSERVAPVPQVRRDSRHLAQSFNLLDAAARFLSPPARRRWAPGSCSVLGSVLGASGINRG